MKKYIFYLFTILMFASCKKSEEATKIKDADWLLGVWENKSLEGNLTETWLKVNDSTFQAFSYFVNEKDTIHFETIILLQKGQKLTYTAAVKGQNNDKPISFKMVSRTDKQLIFENLTHDYPQKITYIHKNKNTLMTRISGIQQGKASSEEFSMKKIK